MPVPMIAPMPSAVRSSRPTRALERPPSVSATSASTGFVANSRRWTAACSFAAPAGRRSEHGSARAAHELERDVAEHPLGNRAALAGADHDQVGVVLLREQQDARARRGRRATSPVASTPFSFRCADHRVGGRAAPARGTRISASATGPPGSSPVHARRRRPPRRSAGQVGGRVRDPVLVGSRLRRDHDALHAPWPFPSRRRAERCGSGRARACAQFQHSSSLGPSGRGEDLVIALAAPPRSPAPARLRRHSPCPSANAT